MNLAPGTRLGHYQIVGLLGAGGMGVVYRAEDTRLGREVALKFLSKHLVLDGGALDRFQREARTASALNHPHICTIYDIDECDGQPFISMELLEGEPLRARVTSAPLPVPVIIEFGVQLADALEAAHAKGIVHRDIKPENIFITTRGAAKLLDFGIAKLVTEQVAAIATATATRLGTGPVALGSVAYMSPEQVRGEALDARTDLFSLGVVLYEMATGQQPFKGTTSGAVLGEILTKAPTAPVRLNADVPPELERIVNKLLEKDRELRYQTARDVRVDLERLRRTLALSATTSRAAGAAASGPSIAVLPFVNMSGDQEQEYFSDGLAEEVINVLSRIPGLKVIARTSAFAFKGKQQDVRTIAEALGVTNILEGSVRKAANRVRITAQLVTSSDGTHLWSDRYDRDLTDIFAIQDEIASEIANALQVKLSATRTSGRRAAPSPDAYEAYLKSLYLQWRLTPDAMTRSRECLEQAIALDPAFALAHFALAHHYWILASVGYLSGREAMPRLREEAQASLELEPNLAEAHAMLGAVAASYDYDWREAGRRFSLALSADPVPPIARQVSSYLYLIPTGRSSEAVLQARQSVASDPLNVAMGVVLANALIADGRLHEAETVSQKALELEKNYAYACANLALSLTLQGRWPEALTAAERAVPRLTFMIGMVAGIRRRLGDERGAAPLIAEVQAAEKDHSRALSLAWCHAMSGDLEQSADWMEKVIAERHPDAPNHSFMLFRSSPRWPALSKLLRRPLGEST